MKELLAIAFAFVTASTASAGAQTYRSRLRLAVRWIRVRDLWPSTCARRSIIIENIGSAAGGPGAGRVARSVPER
jgi:hypothetical protein